MGNTKSTLSRDELAHWANDLHTLEAIKDELKSRQRRSTRDKSKSCSSKKSIELEEIDNIYHLVKSLKRDGKEGRELLERFVKAQADLLPEKAFPVKSISVHR
ncbi:expressed unknown protein [Seminavis robusta]|uniref:Uncharacterized protein n=1 Tax=Seminavis robusta TaxID=568900 RepID=A0A9N8D9I2_9STRA|nr:expressed unknown protein [Seminavis robusta]|eukprot:Sro24_g016290.1 n/a (103) ;mRNA; f:29410-29718